MAENTTDGTAKLKAQGYLEKLSEVKARLMVAITMKPLDFDSIIDGKNLTDITPATATKP